MENNKTITAGELGEKLKVLEQEVSPWARAGMRAYTLKELDAYRVSLVIIDFLESEKLINGEKMRNWWTLYAPTEHQTIKESKPINAKSDELEVFEKVHAKIVRGEMDIDDFKFIKEIEKRLEGVEIFPEEFRNKIAPKILELNTIISKKSKH